uniref:J domain-containing protein n=1 Tax=Kalanchoe fedtschenkoi TaxID=63787 RepID=A0A7N1A5A3_KALFE
MEISMSFNLRCTQTPSSKTRVSISTLVSEMATDRCKTRCEITMPRKPKPNLYHLLSLDSQNAGFDEIKKAYRSLALKYHPDVCPRDDLIAKEECTRRFVEVCRAYETLSDPVSRQVYDHQLRLGEGSSEMERDSGSRFCREVWESQLSELRRRCCVKKNRKVSV